MPGKFCILLSFLIHASVVAGWFHLAGGLPIPPEPTPAPTPPDPTLVELEKAAEPREAIQGEGNPKEPTQVEQQSRADRKELLGSRSGQDQRELPPPETAESRLQEAVQSLQEPSEQTRAGEAAASAKATEFRAIKYAVQSTMPTLPAPRPPVEHGIVTGAHRPGTPIAGTLSSGQTADNAQRTGVQVPNFSVTLTPDEIDAILTAGQACLVVFCKDDRFIVQGTTRAPREITPAATRRLQGFSDRALPVPLGYCGVVSDCLRRELNIPEDRLRQCQFRLLLNNRLDLMILTRQQAAANSLRFSLEDIRHTFGKFEFSDHSVSDFLITGVLTNKGELIPLGSRNTGPSPREILESASETPTPPSRGS